MGDFNAQVGTDTDTWKGVIGKHGVTGLNENGRYLLQLCCSYGFRVMNIFFQRREVHKYTWYRPSMDKKSLIDFCIVSSDLFSDVLDVRVKQGAELSTDHHLVVRSGASPAGGGGRGAMPPRFSFLPPPPRFISCSPRYFLGKKKLLVLAGKNDWICDFGPKKPSDFGEGLFFFFFFFGDHLIFTKTSPQSNSGIMKKLCPWF